MISQTLYPLSKLTNENVYSNYNTDLYLSSTDNPSRAEINASTALEICKRSDIPQSCVSDVLEYISLYPKRKNTKFKGVKEVHNLLDSNATTGFFRFFGSGMGRYKNVNSGSYSASTASTHLGAYSSAKAISTCLTLYSSDSGHGNDLFSIADVYKISGDHFTKAYRSHGNQDDYSEFKVSVTSEGLASFVIKGAWDSPLSPVNISGSVSLERFSTSTFGTNSVLFNSRPIGNVSNYLIMNGHTGSLNITPKIVNKTGVISNDITTFIHPQGHAIISTTMDVVELVGDAGPFIVGFEKEYNYAGDDLIVEFMSNNGSVTVICETVYEVEISELLTTDITSDDYLKFYMDVESYPKRGLRATTGYAGLASIISSVLSVAAEPLVSRAKETWKHFRYKDDVSLWQNVKSFFSDFAGSKDSNSKSTVSSTGRASIGEGSSKTGRAMLSSKMVQAKIKDLRNDFKVNKGSPSNEDPYKTRFRFPILDSVGLSPFLNTIKTRVEGGINTVIKLALPTGFQYFPAITNDNKHVVMCALIKTNYPISSVAYGQRVEVYNHTYHFDNNFGLHKDVTNKIIDKITDYLQVEGGSFKQNLFSDTYFTFESGNNELITDIIDESWLAALTLVVEDAPDGSFVTGSFEYNKFGFFHGADMDVEVIHKKMMNVKNLIVLTSEKSAYEYGVSPYDATGIYLGAKAGALCVSKISFWTVANLEWASRNITKDTYFANGVFSPYKPGTKVYSNFQKQIYLLKESDPLLKVKKYDDFLDGIWTSVSRLPHPMKSLIGIKFREVTTFQDPSNIAADSATSFADPKVDKGKIDNYITYGRLITVNPIEPKERGEGRLIPYEDFSKEILIREDVDTILKTLANLRSQNLNAILSNYNLKTRLHNPITNALHHALNSLGLLVVGKGFANLMQAKSFVANVKRYITNFSQDYSSEIKGEKGRTYHSLLLDNGFYSVNSVNNEEIFKLVRSVGDTILGHGISNNYRVQNSNTTNVGGRISNVPMNNVPQQSYYSSNNVQRPNTTQPQSMNTGIKPQTITPNNIPFMAQQYSGIPQTQSTNNKPQEDSSEEVYSAGF